MEYFYTFLKGFAMGAANIIPGVSGGTIAFITGIYERLINTLKSFDLKAIRYLLKFDFGSFAKHVDFGFILALGLGVVTSVLTLAKLLKGAYLDHPIMVNAFFFGLILASIFSVGRMVRSWRFMQIVALLLGLGVAVSLALMSPRGVNPDPSYLALCGVAAMCSMIIPGVSGSFILLLMGNYKLIMLDAVDNLRQMKFVEALPVLIPVGLGAIVGLAVLSRVLSWLFKKYHNTAVALVTGFVAGSLIIIWPWKNAVYSGVIKGKVITWDRYFPNILESSTWIAIAWLLAGIALIAVIEKLSAKPAA
jgi:putative membrane protein